MALKVIVKQVVQNLRTGVLERMEVPCPQVSRGNLLIQTRASLISAGTERFVVEFGKASLVAKARQNPERVKQVLSKIKADGLLPTLEAVFTKLDEPLPLGYCNAGQVLEVGEGVEGYAVGDRVASNGHHAEIVKVPVHLCAKIPSNVTDEEASFAVLGAIALQGIRLLKPELGEQVVVFGLGLVGLLAVQMLVASGVKRSVSTWIPTGCVWLKPAAQRSSIPRRAPTRSRPRRHSVADRASTES